MQIPNEQQPQLKLALVNVSDGGEPYGLILLATYLKKNLKNLDVKIININRKTGYIAETGVPIEAFITELEKYNPDVIGISAMTIFYERSKKLAQKLKEHDSLKNKTLILGGTHISTLPESLHSAFDVAVIGEAEATFTELLAKFAKKQPTKKELKEIKGIAYLENETLVKTEPRELLNIDDIPLPSKEFAYMNVTFDAEDGNSARMMTSRGCPYFCRFCSTTIFWKNKIRFMGPERVFNEIKLWYYDFDVKKIGLWDDLFTINKDRLSKIADLLEKEGIAGKIEFECMAKSNCIDEEMAQVLKRLGVTGMNFGFESGSPRMLEYLKKNSGTIENHKKAIELSNKYGIKCSGSLVFGSPTETIQDMEMTIDFIDWCIKHNAEHIWSFVMTPFPGTELWQVAKQRGTVSDNMDFDLLSHENLDHPLLLDPEIKVEDFKKVFLKARSKLRFFILKIWMKRFKKHPIRTTQSVLKDFRFIKFFTGRFM